MPDGHFFKKNSKAYTDCWRSTGKAQCDNIEGGQTDCYGTSGVRSKPGDYFCRSFKVGG